MRLLLDNCLGSDIADLLQLAGHTIIRAAGPEERQPDDAMMAFAVAEKLVIVTEDSDFDQYAIFRRMPHCGIVRVAQLAPFEAGRQIIEALELHADELAEGAMVIIGRERTRVR